MGFVVTHDDNGGFLTRWEAMTMGPVEWSRILTGWEQ